MWRCRATASSPSTRQPASAGPAGAFRSMPRACWSTLERQPRAGRRRARSVRRTDTDITIGSDGTVDQRRRQGQARIVEFAIPQNSPARANNSTRAARPSPMPPAPCRAPSRKSNVSGVAEMTEMIRVQRAYQSLASRWLQKQDDMRPGHQRLGDAERLTGDRRMKASTSHRPAWRAQERNVEVISNNIANMRTTGYKRQRAEFQDLLYQAYRRAGSTTSDPGHDGAGRHRDRLGREDRRHAARHEPGQRRDAHREGTRRRHPRRRLLHGAAARRPHRLHPRRLVRTRQQRPAGQCRRLPDRARHHDPRGANARCRSAPTAWSRPIIGTDSAPTQLGQLQLARFVNKAGLEASATTCSSRPPRAARPRWGAPTRTASATCCRATSKCANVNAVTEIADLIAAQRAYEMNARVISGPTK
jgi:flagellar basal-body rod protein FlgG